MPLIGGAEARAPEAITAFLNLSCVTSPEDVVTETVLSSTKLPWPKKTSMPKSEKRSAESAGLISARFCRIRSIAFAKSTAAPSGTSTPNCAALRTVAATRAAPMTPLEGTQPTLRQSPPISSRSINATRAPSPAAPAAVTKPAVPAPMTTRW